MEKHLKKVFFRIFIFQLAIAFFCLITSCGRVDGITNSIEVSKCGLAVYIDKDSLKAGFDVPTVFRKVCLDGNSWNGIYSPSHIPGGETQPVCGFRPNSDGTLNTWNDQELNLRTNTVVYCD